MKNNYIQWAKTIHELVGKGMSVEDAITSTPPAPSIVEDYVNALRTEALEKKTLLLHKAKSNPRNAEALLAQFDAIKVNVWNP